MAFDDEEEFLSFVGGDHLLPTFTQEAVEHEMDGFPLPLITSRDMAWLTVASRRALAISMRHFGDGPQRMSPTEIRAELERLAGLTSATWLELFECKSEVESRLWDHASNHWDGEGGVEFETGKFIGEPSMHIRYKAAIRELDWLSAFLRDAARETKAKRGPWRSSEERQIRLERALYLAIIFEAAFGERVTANNWRADGWRGDAYSKAKTPFMDFYQRMVKIAFGEEATPDLSGVLKDACREHKVRPARFAEGMIPGL